MTMPASGPISLYDARTELSLSGAISLQQSEVRGLFDVPAGAIDLFDGYGKSAGNTPVLAVGHLTAPYMSIYLWSSVGGFGPKFANPTPAITSSINSEVFSPDGTVLFAVRSGGGYPIAYHWSEAGYGALYPNPATATTNTTQIAVSPDGKMVAVGVQSFPYVYLFHWDNVTGFGTNYSGPTTGPAGPVYDLAFSPDSKSLAVCHDKGAGTVGISIYKVDSASSAFGTRYADTATLSGKFVSEARFDPSGQYLAVALSASPFVQVFPWSYAGGFGSVFANPLTIPNAAANSVAWSPDGAALAVGHTGTNKINVYPWSPGGFGTKYPNPLAVPASNVGSVYFSKDGKSIALGLISAPYIQAYPWNNGFGAKFADPTTTPTGSANCAAFG